MKFDKGNTAAKGRATPTKPESLDLKKYRQQMAELCPLLLKEWRRRLAEDRAMKLSDKDLVAITKMAGEQAHGRPSTWAENEWGLPANIMDLPRDQQRARVKELKHKIDGIDASFDAEDARAIGGMQ